MAWFEGKQDGRIGKLARLDARPGSGPCRDGDVVHRGARHGRVRDRHHSAECRRRYRRHRVLCLAHRHLCGDRDHGHRQRRQAAVELRYAPRFDRRRVDLSRRVSDMRRRTQYDGVSGRPHGAGAGRRFAGLAGLCDDPGVVLRTIAAPGVRNDFHDVGGGGAGRVRARTVATHNCSALSPTNWPAAADGRTGSPKGRCSAGGGPWSAIRSPPTPPRPHCTRVC